MRNKLCLGIWLTLLLLYLTPAEAGCEPVASNSVHIVFTSAVSGDDPEVLVDQPGGFVDISENTITSLVPVAEPGAYVELFADGQSVSGAWADQDGKVTFASLLPVEPSARLRLVQRSGQTLSVANGSAHRVTRPHSVAANPGICVYGDKLLMAYESGDGQISTASWDWQSGRRDFTEDTSFGQGRNSYCPRPAADPAGDYVWVYFARRDGASHCVYRASLPSKVETVVRGVAAPCDIAVASTPSGHTMFYTGSISGDTSEYTCMHSGAGGSSWILIKSPPALTDLTTLAAPDGYCWTAGEQNGTISVYRGSLLKKQVSGSAPSLCLVKIDNAQYVCLTYLAQGELFAHKQVLHSLCFSTSGTPVGAPKQITAMPEGAGRMAGVGRAGSEIIVFWDQEIEGESQVFFTTLRVAV